MRLRLAWITAVGWAAAAACAEPYDEWPKLPPSQPRPDSGAPKDAAAEIDAAPAYACERTAAFGAPTHISGGVNTADDERWASLSADERTLYFARKPQGDAGIWDLFVARRVDRGAAFDVASPLSINTPDHVETSPTVSADERTIFFASDRLNGYREIFVATRLDPSSAFGTPTLVKELSDGGAAARPFLRFDASELWFVSYRPVEVDASSLPDGGLHNEIYRSAIVGGDFMPPARVLELGSEADEFDPVVSADGLDIFFASDRGDGGVYRIWTAHRDSPFAVAFVDLHVVSELMSPEGEFPAWISPDGCRLYFTSNRAGGAGGSDLWVAERPAASTRPGDP